jgi:hypothetical protein
MQSPAEPPAGVKFPIAPVFLTKEKAAEKAREEQEQKRREWIQRRDGYIRDINASVSDKMNRILIDLELGRSLPREGTKFTLFKPINYEAEYTYVFEQIWPVTKQAILDLGYHSEYKTGKHWRLIELRVFIPPPPKTEIPVVTKGSSRVCCTLM